MFVAHTVNGDIRFEEDADRYVVIRDDVLLLRVFDEDDEVIAHYIVKNLTHYKMKENYDQS